MLRTYAKSHGNNSSRSERDAVLARIYLYMFFFNNNIEGPMWHTSFNISRIRCSICLIHDRW